MVIVVRDFVSSCHTNHEGEIIFNQIAQSIFNGRCVTISFKGISSVTTSFLNSALIPLLDRVKFDQLKSQLRIVDSSRTINDSIVRRFKQETEVVSV